MPTTDTIYVVSYSTGEHSDRLDWPAAWYEHEADANAHVAEWKRRWDAARATFRPERLYERLPMNDAVRAFYAMALPEKVEGSTFYPLDVYRYNTPDVTPVPRGTLALHGLQEA